MAAAECGIFEVDLPDDFVTLSDEQRKMFMALFFKKMLHDQCNRRTREDANAKQYKPARDSMRKNELRIQKNKMKKSIHNQWLIKILLKLNYNIEDSYECYDFLGKDKTVEGTVNQALGWLFAFDPEKAAQAFLKQVNCLKEMNEIVKQENYAGRSG